MDSTYSKPLELFLKEERLFSNRPNTHTFYTYYIVV